MEEKRSYLDCNFARKSVSHTVGKLRGDTACVSGRQVLLDMEARPIEETVPRWDKPPFKTPFTAMAQRFTKNNNNILVDWINPGTWIRVSSRGWHNLKTILYYDFTKYMQHILTTYWLCIDACVSKEKQKKSVFLQRAPRSLSRLQSSFTISGVLFLHFFFVRFGGPVIWDKKSFG